MTEPTAATNVFSVPATSGRCAVAFLARRQPVGEREERSAIGRTVVEILDQLARSGWHLSVRAMLAPDGISPADAEPAVYATGFAHDIDLAGLFEAPSITTAIDGTIALEAAGWARLFSTQWLIGPRDFAAVRGAPGGGRDWGFLALWEWNDAWAAASAAERRAYDLECDEAFAADLNLGINIAGRHRLDWASSWHQLGVWELATPDDLDAAMLGHERVADFKFTTSRHFLGRRRPLREFLDAEPA